MAILTTEEKVKLRNAAERKARALDIPVRWVKGAINDTGQAIEDVLDAPAFISAVSSAIDAASAPYSVAFTASEKKWLFALVVGLKYNRDK